MGRCPGWKRAALDRALDAIVKLLLHGGDELEAVPVAADARHRAVDEHQREVLGMRLAERVVVPEHRADFVE